MKRITITLLAVCLMCSFAANADEGGGNSTWRGSRRSTLTAAKNMVLTTKDGTTYFYLVSDDDIPVMYRGEKLRIGKNEFDWKEVNTIRFRSLEHFVLNEDSTTFNRLHTVDHGLAALRYTFTLGQWNSIVLPFELDAKTIRYVFGDDAMIATVHGISKDDDTTVELQTLDLNDESTTTRVNVHYLIKPTREPDIASTTKLYNFGGDPVPGPIYLIPNVNVKVNQNPRSQSFSNDDESTKIRVKGTYLKLDDSVLSGKTVRNSRVEPGVYMLNDEGKMAITTDSTVVLAFHSWIEDLSENKRQLRFYIDGVDEDITASIGLVKTTARKRADDDAVYDLSGRRMPAGRLTKGIYIINGKKVVIK